MSSRQDNENGEKTSHVGRPPTQVFIEDLSQMHLQEVEQIDSWATSYRKPHVSKPTQEV